MYDLLMHDVPINICNYMNVGIQLRKFLIKLNKNSYIYVYIYIRKRHKNKRIVVNAFHFYYYYFFFWVNNYFHLFSLPNHEYNI